MELIRYRNAVIYIKGKPDRQKLEEAAVRFYKKVHMQKRRAELQNGNSNKA